LTPAANSEPVGVAYQPISRDTNIDVPTFLRNRLNR
jgi:hypothetical protein